MAISRNRRKSHKVEVIVIVGSILGFCIALAPAFYSQYKSDCENGDGVLEGLKCREMTVAELFNKKCRTGISFNDGTSYSCDEISRAGLEQAYLRESGIKKHAGKLYETGTEQEVAAGKAAGNYCLEASDTWNYYYSKKCVVFRYEYIACASGHCYIDEKKDYKNGFVAYFPTNYNWSDFNNVFGDFGPILVCGVIEQYQGHPQIKVYNPKNQIRKNPTASFSGNYTVYKYTCN